MTLRIERTPGLRGTRIRLSGELRQEDLAQLTNEIGRGGHPVVALDLEELGLVDVAGVRFLNRREAEGIAVVNCSHYIREWMHQERAREKEGAGPRSES